MDMRILLEIYEESFWRISTSGTSYFFFYYDKLLGLKCNFFFIR